MKFIPIIETIYQNGLKNPDKTAMKYHDNDYKWLNLEWKQIYQYINKSIQFFRKNNINSQDRVIIYSTNCFQWQLIDLTCQTMNLVTVPLHSVESAANIDFIVSQTESTVACVRSQKEYDTITKIDNKFKVIVVFNDDVVLNDNIKSVKFSDIVNTNEASTISQNEIESMIQKINSDDLFSIVYTSGTTGTPKGVMLTHGNIAFQRDSHSVPIKKLHMPANAISLALLPLSHILERGWSLVALSYNYTIAYLDDPAKFSQTLQDLNPHMMCTVPRIYEKIYQNIHDTIRTKNKIFQKIFNNAISIAEKHLFQENQKVYKEYFNKIFFMFYKKLLLNPLKKRLGSNLAFTPCGGAPLSPTLQKFFFSLGIYVCGGYGLTETTASVTSQVNISGQDKILPGATGLAMNGVKIKISDEGEILIKGGNVMKGYYKNPEATKLSFTEDGWLKSGDIGLFGKNSELIITDRLKDLMKTSGGKYIAPQPIEAIFTNDQYIEQFVLIAEEKKYVTALIYPNWAILKEFAEKNVISFRDKYELLKNPVIYELYAKRIAEKTEHLAYFEKIKKFTFLSDPLSISNGELTPTLKYKRKIICKNYSTLINAMY